MTDQEKIDINNLVWNVCDSIDEITETDGLPDDLYRLLQKTIVELRLYRKNNLRPTSNPNVKNIDRWWVKKDN